MQRMDMSHSQVPHTINQTLCTIAMEVQHLENEFVNGYYIGNSIMYVFIYKMKVVIDKVIASWNL